MDGIHIFNPENDLALAHFTTHYTPPASAVQMARELAVFPIWFARGNHPLVIAEGESNREYLQKMKRILPIKAKLISYGDLPMHRGHQIIPWGWNPSLVQRLKDHGADDKQLLTVDALKTLREYSHRRHAVEMLQTLLAKEGPFIGDARYFERVEELLTYLHASPGDKLLKMPLSGSGKGLIRIMGAITDKQVHWAQRVIRQQGGVVAETLYTRVKDFAMEYQLNQGTAQFTGYSLFQTTSSGAYMGNKLLNDKQVLNDLSPYVTMGTLQQLSQWLEKELARRFPRYSGYAGVDMMVCDTGAGYRLHPCVEINMRMNMGVASRLIHEQYIKEGKEGQFKVTYFKKPDKTLSFHHAMTREFPLVVENKKVTSGYLPLTPVTPQTHYHAYLIVES